MRMTLSGSRTEFLSSDTLGTTGDIQYGRGGGCFVSIRRGLLIAAAVIAALIAVGLLVYYLAPCPPGGCRGATGDVSSSGQHGGEPTPGPEIIGTTLKPLNASELRLPEAVRPRYYSIWLQPFVGNESNNNFTYKGLVDVEVSCVSGDASACSSISLHAKDLSLMWDAVALRQLPLGMSMAEARACRAVGKKYNASAEAYHNASTTPATQESAQETQMKIVSHEISPEKDMVTFTLEKSLEKGINYSLEIPFWGNVTTELSGLYRSNYTDNDGTNRWLAVTHFEPTSARKAFPCFDEPAMKAQFEVHVARRQNFSTLSNMPRNSTEAILDQPGWFWDHYPASPVMSTYLVAVIVSQLERRSASSVPNQPAFEVVARPDLLPTAEYALKVGPTILQHYETYFNLPYPLPKMTMAAVPDFAAGAMENWGLIIYRESLMLYDRNTSTDLSLYNVASVIAHELAHQWFGNIVTMAWWTDLWLNEGFATYVSYIGVNKVEPSWNILEKIVTDEMHPVLETDSLNSTHPVSVEVSNPSQISEVFDDVSYNKGACLIRMLNHSLTEPVFRAGLSAYLNKWEYANAQQDDLWAALTAAAKNTSGLLLPADTTVKGIMDTWTLQKGYPMVTAERDYTAGTIKLTQRPFSLHMRANDTVDPSDSRAWHIPVSYASEGDMAKLADTRPRAWLSPKNKDGLTIHNVTTPGSNSWVVLNLQQTGYYRVNYDMANWRLITSLLHTSPTDTLPATTRAQLISDSFNLARAGQLQYALAFNLTKYLERETNPAPWYAFMWSHSFLDDMLRGTRHYPDLQAFVRRLVRPLVETLGKTARPEDSQPVRQLRTAALSRLIYAEDPALLRWVRVQFDAWLNATAEANPVPVDLRSAVYCAAARWGGAREWNALEARFRASDQMPVERLSLLRALMCTREPHLIVTMLERSLEQRSGIRLQDSLYVWRAAPNNPIAAPIAFRYLRENWDQIYAKYKKVSFVLKTVLRSSIMGLSTKSELKEADEFVTAHQAHFTDVARTVAQAMEWLRLRVRWRQEHQEAVAQWLASETSTRSTATSTTDRSSGSTATTTAIRSSSSHSSTANAATTVPVASALTSDSTARLSSTSPAATDSNLASSAAQTSTTVAANNSATNSTTTSAASTVPVTTAKST